MGFVDKLRAKLATDKPNTATDPPRLEWVQWSAPSNVIVGEERRQSEFEAVIGKPRSEGYLLFKPVTLRREPTNSHDPNALKAYYAGTHLGYLRAKYAETISPRMDEAGITEYSIAGIARGGSSNRSEQANLRLQVWTDRLITKGFKFAPGSSDIERIWPPFAKDGRPEFEDVCSACGSFQIRELPDGMYNCLRCGEITNGQ
jgi:hypothetical protein